MSTSANTFALWLGDSHYIRELPDGSQVVPLALAERVTATLTLLPIAKRKILTPNHTSA